MNRTAAPPDHAPLLSSRFVWKVTAAVALVCLLTLTISIAGRVLGRSMMHAGHTTDTTPFEIVIGSDLLMLPANVIRLASARRAGVHEAIDTYFAWPGMEGYSESNRDLFNQTDSARGMVFARVTQATMSRDMSGRFVPIYSRLVDGSPAAGPAGLVSYRLKPETGYANELLYVDAEGGDAPYTVRCLLEHPEAGDFNTRTGCQRDIALGQDLSVTYRFSIDLLTHWRDIERDLRARFETMLR